MKQTILVVLFLLILAATVFVWYRSVPAEGESMTPTSGESGVRLTELRRLKTLKLDTSVFRDPFFGSLQLPPEAANVEQGQASAGRVNPFLPF